MHCYLAHAEPLHVFREPHGGQLAIGAVPAEREDRRHNELVEVSAWRRPLLLLVVQPFADYPRLFGGERVLDFRRSGDWSYLRFMVKEGGALPCSFAPPGTS